MRSKSLDKKKKGKQKEKGSRSKGKKTKTLAFLFALLSANVCVYIIQRLTPTYLPGFFVIGWLIIYTVVLYKKFKNEMGHITGEIQNNFSNTFSV
jgi:hypothetical protein